MPEGERSWMIWALAAGFLTACGSAPYPLVPAEQTRITVERRPMSIVPAFQANRLLVSCFDRQLACEVDIEAGDIKQRFLLRRGPNQLIRDRHRGLIYCLHTMENVIAIFQKHPIKLQQQLSTGSLTLSRGALRPDGRELWVTDGQNAVYILIPPGLQLQKKIILGRYPEGICFSPEGDLAFVALKGENQVAVIDVFRKKEIKKIAVGIYPRRLVSHDREVWVSNYGSASVHRIDIRDLGSGKEMKLLANPLDLAFVQNTLWVGCQKDRALLAIDPRSSQVKGMIRAGFVPADLTALADGRLAVANPSHGQVVIYYPRENAEDQ
jgi:YVTN family beta-propeller protein